ncbi:DUF3566 domain-containing protein [Rhodococcus hoagii]|nr:DUF3566 domain-containing protein [Prescottella equi]
MAAGQQQKAPAQGPNGSARPEAPGKPPAKAQPARPVVTGTAAAPNRRRVTVDPRAPVVTGTAAPKPPAADRRDVAKARPRPSTAPRAASRAHRSGQDMPDLSAVPRQRPASGSARKAALTAAVTRGREPLRATVQLRRIDPWSTLKVSLLISVALFFVWMVGGRSAVTSCSTAWGVGPVEQRVHRVHHRLERRWPRHLRQCFGYSALVGVMNVVLFTALATIGSFIYNLCSDLVGGVQVTLADPD